VSLSWPPNLPGLEIVKLWGGEATPGSRGRGTLGGCRPKLT